jgi:hypothetical protein
VLRDTYTHTQLPTTAVHAVPTPKLRINRENGVNDMVELYCERGMAVADAQTVVGALSKYDKFFVDVMLSEELGLPNYKVLNFAVIATFTY